MVTDRSQYDKVTRGDKFGPELKYDEVLADLVDSISQDYDVQRIESIDVTRNLGGDWFANVTVLVEAPDE